MSYTSQQEQIPGIRSIARTLTGGDAELSITSVGGTPNIGASLSNRVLITGTTTITSFGSVPNIIRFVRFAGILTLTHNGTSLVLPTGTNIITAADDIALFTSDASGNWRLISYNKANGQALVGSAGGSVVRQSYTATAGQTTQTVSGSYTPGLIDVYINGSKLVNGDDVIVTSGTSVTFTVPLIVGDAIDIIGSLSAVGSALLSSSIRQSLTPSTEGQTVFTVSGGYAPNALDVYYNGSKLQPVTDVTTSSGSTLTLLFPSTLTDVIEVVGVTVLSSIGTVSRQSFVATAGQVDFFISGGYQANSIDVFQNGVKLQNAVDVTVTTGTKVTLITPAALNDIIDVCASQQAGGNGVCNLSTTQDATTVTVVSSTGGSAVLPAATTSNAGVMSAADKVTLRNYGMKNRIINGGMDISQRGTSFVSPSVNTYNLDRWKVQMVTSGTVTVTKNSDVPSNNEFQNSLRVATTAIDTSIAAGDVFQLDQYIEGYNIRDLIGRTFTLSFWVRSTKTGVHCVAFQNYVGDRSYISEYNVTVSNTWQYKTVTVTGGLTAVGTWNYINGVGLAVRFALMAGTNWQSTTGSWLNSSATATSTQVNCLDSISNIFAVTGVQLELGSQATEFEHRPIGAELALCQRYFDKSFPVSTAPAQNFGRQGALETLAVRTAGLTGLSSYVRFSVPMRATPSLTFFNPSAANAQARNIDLSSDCSATSGDNTSDNSTKIQYTLPASTVAANLISVHWTASAEL